MSLSVQSNPTDSLRFAGDPSRTRRVLPPP